MKSFIFLILILFPLFSFGIENSNIKIEEMDQFSPVEIAFYDIDGDEYFLNEFENSPTLLVFWASWCSSCVDEIKDLDILAKDFRKIKINFIALSEDFKGAAAVKDFYKENKIRTLKGYFDKHNQLFRSLGVNGLPTAFIISKDGKLKAKIIGNPRWHEDDVREYLLSFVEGDVEMPRNTYKEKAIYNITDDKDEEDIKNQSKKNNVDSENSEIKNDKEETEEKIEKEKEQEEEDEIKKKKVKKEKKKKRKNKKFYALTLSM